jgi:hypothetical protein
MGQSSIGKMLLTMLDLERDTAGAEVCWCATPNIFLVLRAARHHSI